MSAAVAAAATAAAVSQRRSGTASRRSDTITDNPYGYDYSNRRMPQHCPNRYESQKREDWQSFLRYLRDQRRPMALSRLSEADIVQFLQYVDEEFGNTKVHEDTCSLFGKPSPPNSCPCPLRQAWGSLNALVCRLRAAFEENGGRPETNPFASSGVKLYLVEAREAQAKARGISFC